jgi:hypothetical protein
MTKYIVEENKNGKFYYDFNDPNILHRENGPAVESVDGSKYWSQHGKRHRKDGPAVEYPNGHKEWYQNGKLHREDGPAVEHANGNKSWYQNGKRHREDGPAVECTNGHKEWYLEGVQYTEEEFLKKTCKSTCVEEVITVGKKKYKLVPID